MHMEGHAMQEINLKCHSVIYDISLFIICRWWETQRTIRIPLAEDFSDDSCSSFFVYNLGSRLLKEEMFFQELNKSRA